MEPEPPGAAFLPGAGADPFWSEPETVSGPRTSGAGASSLPTVIFSFFPQVNCLYFINVRRLKKAIRKISKDSSNFLQFIWNYINWVLLRRFLSYEPAG